MLLAKRMYVCMPDMVCKWHGKGDGKGDGAL